MFITYLYFLTPWSRLLSEKANRLSDNQAFPRILWELKFHHRLSKRLQPLSTQRQIIPVLALLPYILMIQRNIIIPSTPGSSKRSLTSGFSTKHPYVLLPHTCFMSRPSHSSKFDQRNIVWWGVQIIQLLIMQFSEVPCYLRPIMMFHKACHFSLYIAKSA
jgi:hypothetical protein